MNLTVYSSEGRMVLSERLQPEKIGVNERKIDVSELSDGLYIIEINNGSYSDQKQFIKK
ncbi:MAG: T9SS type A sorting domain-containing protein [Crocinitomicaceae bacterium]